MKINLLAGISVLGVAIAIPANAASLSSYSTVYVAPVEVADSLKNRPTRPRHPTSSSRHKRPVTASDLEDKVSDLHDDLTDILDDQFEVVDAAGDGVLTVTPTLVDVVANRPTLADYKGNPSLGFGSRFAGGAKVSFTFEEDGSALGSYKKSWYDTLDLDEIEGATWSDANRAFRIISRSLSKHIAGN